MSYGGANNLLRRIIHVDNTFLIRPYFAAMQYVGRALNFGSVEEAAAESHDQMFGRFDVHYLTIDGVVRKLWNADARAYADHLLRLDPASRRNRFGGAVADQFVRHHADRRSAPPM